MASTTRAPVAPEATLAGGGIAILSGNDVVDGSFIGDTATGGAGGNGLGGGFFGANSPGGNGGDATGGGMSIASGTLIVPTAEFIGDAANGGAGGIGGYGNPPAPNGTDGTGIGGALDIGGTSVVVIEQVTLAGNVASTSDPNIFGTYST